MIRTLALAIVVLATVPAQAQTSVAPPPKAFDVVSIKLTDPSFGGVLIQTPGPGTVAFRGYTVTDLIAFAFDVDRRQVRYAQGSESVVRYDIVARSPSIISQSAVFTGGDVRLMLQTLLAERFALVSHREAQDVQVYAMRVAKGGHKLKPRMEGDGGAPLSMLFQGAELPGRNVPISLLADALQKVVLERPVIDRTGLQGTFDFDLAWRPDATQFKGRGGSMPAASDPDRADIFTALQEQLGLKLDGEKAPTTVIVVDAVNRPSEN